MTRLEGIELNDETGEVTVTREDVLSSTAAILNGVARRAKGGNAAEAIQQRAKEFSDEFQRLTGRKLKGYPFAVPIHIKASDSAGSVAELQYFVLLDVPAREAVSQISQ